MTVARILSLKGRHVVTTHPGRSLREVAEDLVLNRIGAVVVVDDNDEVVGIVSESDVVKAVAARGADVLIEPASHHMAANPPLAREEDPVDDVMETMTRERRRHIPVWRDGRLSGIVSIGDVVKYRIERIEYEHQALREYIAQG
jgi:CBS domain-containing protein